MTSLCCCKTCLLLYLSMIQTQNYERKFVFLIPTQTPSKSDVFRCLRSNPEALKRAYSKKKQTNKEYVGNWRECQQFVSPCAHKSREKLQPDPHNPLCSVLSLLMKSRSKTLQLFCKLSTVSLFQIISFSNPSCTHKPHPRVQTNHIHLFSFSALAHTRSDPGDRVVCW